MASHQQLSSLRGWSPLERLPQGVLEKIAEFCGGIAIFSPTEQADRFTDNIIDSAASNNSYPAQRALFRVAVVKTTSSLMRFTRSLILYPKNRRYVRYLVARITDHVRILPIRFIPPSPLVMSSFIRYIYPVLTTPMADALPEHSFLRQTLKSAIDTLIRSDPSEWGDLIIQIVSQTGINFHTMDDQILTTAVQLCPRIAATRLCFGEPRRYAEGPEPAADRIAPDTFMYSSLLLISCPSKLKSLTLDFGALYSLTRLKSQVPGYPTGCPPSIERLTLVGNRVESELPYELFTIERFSVWLGTNRSLRELRLVDDFDKMIRYADCRATAEVNGNLEPVRTALNWNDILLSYKDSLEVFVMGWHRPSAFGMKARFGASCKLDCLPDMGKLRDLKVPLVALSGSEFIVPLGNDSKLLDLVRSELPASLRRVDLMVVNPPATWAERIDLKWRVVQCQI